MFHDGWWSTEEMSPLLIELKDFLEKCNVRKIRGKNWKQLEKYSKVNAAEFVLGIRTSWMTIYKEKNDFSQGY